jgi:hypothetical protein
MRFAQLQVGLPSGWNGGFAGAIYDDHGRFGRKSFQVATCQWLGEDRYDRCIAGDIGENDLDPGHHAFILDLASIPTLRSLKTLDARERARRRIFEPDERRVGRLKGGFHSFGDLLRLFGRL